MRLSQNDVFKMFDMMFQKPVDVFTLVLNLQKYTQKI